jgi:hypothetical protein
MQELLTPLHTPKLGLVAEALSDPKQGTADRSMSILGLSRIRCHVSLTLNHVDGKIILIVVIFVVVVVVGVVVGDAVAT